jgi:antirestriction protein ArdC
MKTTYTKQTNEERAAKIDAAKAALTEGLKSLVTSDDWTAMLDSMARRGKFSPARFSFRNQILVECQRPGTSAVATFNRWHSIGRYVKKGEKGIAILQPQTWSRTEKNAKGEDEKVAGIFFKVLYTFAYDQTDGAPCPDGVLEGVKLPEATGDAEIETLVKMAKGLDCVSEVEMRDRKPGDLTGAYGWFNRCTKGIVVVTGESREAAALFATLAHEVAHAILHGKDGGEHHDRAEKEVEAESTAYIVCKALGIDTGCFSFKYVAHWAKGDTKLVEQVGTRVAKAAAQILEAFEGAQEQAAEEAA